MAENNRTDEMKQADEMKSNAEQNQTTEMNRDPAMLSLQSELEAMARETPEMPESFRQAWREAVRKEAAAAQAVQADTAESLSAVPAEQADPAKEPAAAEADLTAEPENQTVAAANSTGAPEGSADAAAESSAAPARQPASSSRRPRFALWRAALNFAAIALFILGGSILGRESLTLLRSRPVSAALKAESAVQEVSAPKAGTTLQADSAQEAETALLTGSASETGTGLKANASPRRDVAPQTGTPLPSAIPEVFGAAMETANETAPYDALPEAEEAEVMEETEVLEEAEVMADAAVPEMAAAGSADRGEAPAAAGGAVMNSMDFPPEDAAGLSDSAVSSSEDASDADSYVEVGEAVYNSSLSYTVIDDAAVPKAAAVPETEAAEEVMEDTAAEEEAAPAALSALPEESAGEPAEESMEESAEEPAKESMEDSAEVIPETSDPAAPGSPRTAVWLLGGILIGLAVFCWAFLLSTRKKAPKGGKKAR